VPLAPFTIVHPIGTITLYGQGKTFRDQLLALTELEP